MRSSIVTGSTSFIGRALVKALLARGDIVYAVVRPDSPNADVLSDCPGVRTVTIDVSNLEKLVEQGIFVENFFHLAWAGEGAKGRSDPGIQQRNIENTLACFRTSKALGCRRFLFAGSQAEYGRDLKIQREDNVCHPDTPYGMAKLEVLKRCSNLQHELGVEYLHARIFSVYGPGDHPWTLIAQCVHKLFRSESMDISNGAQSWNFLHVLDTADALCRLMDAPISVLENNAAVNIASHDTRPIRAFVEEIQALVDGKGELLFQKDCIPSALNLAPDIAKLVALTEFVPRISFQEGIRDLIERERKKQ